MSSNERRVITPVQQMMAACSGAVVTSIGMTPFDVIRVRLQHQSAVKLYKEECCGGVANLSLQNVKRPGGGPNTLVSSAASSRALEYCVSRELDSCAVEEAKAKQFTGTWEGAKKIVKYEGFTALWRGLGVTLAMAIPSNVVYFTMYEMMRDKSPLGRSETYSYINPLVCGSLARVMSATVVSPLELIKTRLQSAQVSKGQSVSKAVMNGIREMVVTDGIRSLWRGLALTLWRDAPFSGIYWGCVEYTRKRLKAIPRLASDSDERVVFLRSFIAGTTGGIIAAFFTNPFDVGKTRRQIQATNSRQVPIGQFLGTIVKEEGFSSLWVGFTPRVMKVAPACAIMLSSYELGKKIFHDQNLKLSVYEAAPLDE